MFKINKTVAPRQIGEGKPDSAVLFVHGLAGSYDTWHNFAAHLSSKWVEADCFGLEYDEYYGSQGLANSTQGFKQISKFIKILFGPDISSLSKHLRTVVDELCESYKHVIIIAHSMGGLIARRYIVDNLERTKSVGKVRTLITYATPHHGSMLANHYLTYFSGFLGIFIKNSKQITDLSIANDFIEDLNIKWTKLGVEEKIEFVRVVGLEDWIVNPDSSSFQDDINAKVIAGKNHFSIIIPDNKKHKDDAFMVAYNHLKNFKTRYIAKMERQSEIDAEYEDFDFDFPLEE